MWRRAYDLAIVGGGINGTGIARDAAGRGFSVFLCDAGDLGGGGTSASTKILGLGARGDGLARGEERASLREADTLLRIAPHAVRAARFVSPVSGGPFARTAGRMAFSLRDRLARSALLPPSQGVTLGGDSHGTVLHSDFTDGIEFSDCAIDDSRLAILNAVDARHRGAEIRPRTRCVVAEREGAVWRLAMEDGRGTRFSIAARTLVNATGPWSRDVLGQVIESRSRPATRLVKCSTIVVPRLYDHNGGYLLRGADGGVAFVAPYEDDFALIGTSEEDFEGEPADAQVDAAEIAWLLATVNDHFQRPVLLEDVVWAWAGMRVVPERKEGRLRRRRGRSGGGDGLFVEASGSEPPLVTITGGAIGTYRHRAEAVLDRLAPVLGRRDGWSAGKALPGGLFPPDGLAELAQGLRSLYPFLEERHALRLVGLYGTRAHSVVSGARSGEDLGQVFGADLTEAEVRYLMAEEWAETVEDILWRRTKLGLRLTEQEATTLGQWLDRAQVPASEPRAGAA